MPQLHSHRSSRHDGDGGRGNRRSGSNSERSSAPGLRADAERKEREGHRRSGSNSERSSASGLRDADERKERGGHRRPELQGSSSSGKSASAVCVMFAFLGLGIVAVAEMVARANNEITHPAFNALSGACTLAALATGFYAQTTQLRRWSRHVKRRLLIGLPVALLTGIIVADNFYDTYKVPGAPPSAQPARPPVAETHSEDNALIKPGWYGELQQEGLWLIISSFGAETVEARRFGRCLLKPVSYATLSLVNLGAPVPVVLRSLQVGLHMDSGEEVQSLSVKPLLAQQTGENADLRPLLTEPRMLTAGVMLPDIPICQEPNFPWARVTAVTVSFSSRTLTVPGRMMTANEKQAMLEKAAVNRQSANTNITADAWFKNL